MKLDFKSILLIIALILGVLVFGGFFVGVGLVVAQIALVVFLVLFVISLVKKYFYKPSK